MENYQTLSLYPKKQENLYDVCLDLNFEKRFIGQLDLSGDGTFTCKRSEKTHLFRKLNAIGINYHLLRSDKVLFKWIVINYINNVGIGIKLVTSRDYFLKYGKQYQFAKKGYELQTFLELNQFGLDKARLFESHKVIQQNLFAEVNNGRGIYSNVI